MKHSFKKCKTGIVVLVISLGIFSGCVQRELPVLRIVQLCDPQLGFGINRYDDDVARLKKAIVQINELAPDLVVIAGDFVNDVNNDEGVATFQQTIMQIKAPVLLTPGNHDLPDPVTAAGLERYHARYGEDFRVITCKGRCIISANSQMWRDAPPEISLQHDHQLQEALQKAQKKGQPVVMLTHVPPFVTSVDEDDEYFNMPKAKRDEMLRLCDENGVFLWLTGHSHSTLQRSHNQITILNGETTSQNFDGHAPGFRLLTVYSDQSFDWDFIKCELFQDIHITNLRCEMLTDPLGIDVATPRLSWEIISDSRGIQQTDFHLLVASSLDKLNAGEGDLWDSQAMKSDASVNVPYGGKKLESRTTCYWKVKVTTNHGSSQWSEPAMWRMGLLHPTDWKAQWTGLDKSFKEDVMDQRYTRLAARYFRKEFDAAQKPVKATVYVCGLGLYKLYINGKIIGDQELSPTPTDYSKVVKYNTFDVTNELLQGKNVIATTLGNGRFFTMRPLVSLQGNPEIRHFGFPKMILQLEITYDDGNMQTVTSDDSWKVTADGPIRANNEFDGEEYDANMEMPGWNVTGFDDRKWLQAELVQAPGGILEAQRNRNIKVMETIHPVAITLTKPGMYILDMGQNIVGWLTMKVKGQAGDKVQLRFAETLQDDGTLFMGNLLEAKVTDIYTLKGNGTELFEPSFTYHGFRFVEITGYPGKPALDDFEGKVLYDEMDVTGQFETSNQTLNQIYRNAYWGIRGNYRGMPTDCPQRSERMGWLGDRAVGSHGESFIFNNNNLYAKWLDDIAQAQRQDGSLPDVAPNYWSIYGDNMTWPGAFLIIANMLYEQYGNREPIEKHYDAMKKWMTYMREKYMVDHIMPKDSYGDWCMPPESLELILSKDPARITDAAVLGTTFYYRMLYLLERFANRLNKPADARAFAEEAILVKKAYNAKFFNREKAQYSNNTVTANLLSLCYGMVPDGFEDKVLQNIVDKTEKDFDGHVSTGLIGIQWLMRGLSDHGRADLAFRIATNRDYPSWGYMIERGATTIWELWNGDTADPTMNSHNHVMLLGDLIVWFYEYLAGIQNAPGSAGFEKIVMRPFPVEGLDYVKASYQSIHGLIKSHWLKNGDTFQWEITIPANTTATVYIPATDKTQLTESGQKASSAQGVKFLKMENEYAVYTIESGSYRFVSTKK